MSKKVWATKTKEGEMILSHIQDWINGVFTCETRLKAIQDYINDWKI